MRSGRENLMFSEGVMPTDELDQYLDSSFAVYADDSVIPRLEQAAEAAATGTDGILDDPIDTTALPPREGTPLAHVGHFFSLFSCSE